MRGIEMAMLWELWRLTRREFAVRSALIALAGLAILGVAGLFDAADDIAFVVLLLAGSTCINPAMSLRKRGSSKCPGFPFTLAYTRPVASHVLVIVPMVYVFAFEVLLYVLPMSLLRLVFEIPFPLLSFSALFGALTVFAAANLWWSTDKATLYAGTFVAVPVVTAFAILPIALGLDNVALEDWPEALRFTPLHYAFIAACLIGSVWLTVLGVERQRHGDTLAIPGLKNRSDGDLGAGHTISRLPEWFSRPLALPCPTSSPIRAQLWFELHSVGWRVLWAGAAAALAIPVILVAEAAVPITGPILLAFVLPALPLVAGFIRMIGVYQTHGHSHLSIFDRTRAIGTGRLIGIKVFVTVASILCAWLMMAAAFTGTLLLLSSETASDVWVSVSMRYLDVAEVNAIRSEIAAAWSTERAVHFAGWAIVGVGSVVASAAAFATVHAHVILHGRRVMKALIGFGLYLLAISATVFVWSNPELSILDDAAIAHIVVSFLKVSGWVSAPLLLILTMYLSWKLLRDRVLSLKQAAAVTLIWGSFAALWAGLLYESGTFNSPSAWEFAGVLALIGLIPLAAAASAPWSFGLLRHQ